MKVLVALDGRSAEIAEFYVSHPLFTQTIQRAFQAEAQIDPSAWVQQELGLSLRYEFQSRFGDDVSRFHIVVDLPDRAAANLLLRKLS
jgi:hypothetical protein